ncbi:MAG: SGNH/GDSL hydrolase family protein [Planctomycetota bacterium]
MKKVLLHTLLYLLGLLGAAQVIAGCGFGFTSYQPGGFYTPDGLKIPLAEIANFLTGGGYLGGNADQHPRGRLTPGLRVKEGYDRPKWDYFDAQGCILVEHNSTGFRDIEFPLQKPPGEFRVLAIGDSFTYGSGVLMQDAWPAVLERGLAADGRAVKVVNCGFATGGYEPSAYTPWLRSDGLLLGPDLVVIGFCLNDMGNGNDVPMLAYQGKTTMNCKVALIDQFWTYFENRRLMAAAPDYAAVVRAHPETWMRTQQALLDMQQLLAEHHVPLVIAVIPMMSGWELKPNPYQGLHDAIDGFCAEHAIPCVDLLPEFAGRSEADIWVHPTDQHPNHIGQKLLADGILRFLRARGLDRAR